MPEVQTVTIELQRPKGTFPGKIGVGHYTVNHDVVMLVDKNGAPYDKIRFSRKLVPGEEARMVACALTRRRLSNKSSGFNRPIHYPKVGF